MKKISIFILVCLLFSSCARGVRITVKNIQTDKYKYEYTIKAQEGSYNDDETIRQLIFTTEEDLFVETVWQSTTKVLSNKDIFNIEGKNGEQ